MDNLNNSISPMMLESLPLGVGIAYGDTSDVTRTQLGYSGSLMTTFSITKRPRKTRAKFSKVRTGCITCKRRHVKCDETKPACKRCIKWGGFCSGYEEPLIRPSVTPEPDKSSSDRARTSSEQPRPLPSRVESGSLSVYSESNTTASSPSSDSSSESTRSNPQSSHGLDTKQDVFDAAFWKDVVPFLIQYNTAVRYANLAIHALILAKQPSPRQSPGGNEKSQYGGALSFYGLALREVRQSNASQGDLRAAILCSMFFVIFEIINGDRAAADAHLYSGRRMLDEFRQRQQPSMPDQDDGAECMRRELRNVLRYLALQYGSLLEFSSSQGQGDDGDEFLEDLVRGEFYSRISTATIPPLLESRLGLCHETNAGH